MADDQREPDPDDTGGDVAAGPQTDSADAATQADMGMVGGAGAADGEGAVQPYGTEEDDQDEQI